MIEAAIAGELWDVYDPTAEPVVSESMLIDGFEVAIDRFEDGSFSAVGIEVPVTAAPSGGVSPMAVGGCTVRTWSGVVQRRGCSVYATWGTITIGAANVGFDIVNGGYDYILNTGYGYQNCIGFSCSSPVRVYFKSKENGSGPARMRWQSDVSNALGSWNNWVELRVGSNSFSTINS